jgi:hypothetical protein
MQSIHLLTPEFGGCRDGCRCPAFSQSAKVFPISGKTVAHCFALPKGPLGAREGVSAPTGAAFDRTTQFGATIASPSAMGVVPTIFLSVESAVMWINRLLYGVLRVLTPLGPRYLGPSFLERAYLLWTFRNFPSLPLVVLNHRQQKLVDRLYSQQKFVSLSFENGTFDQLLIGTVERLSPRHSQTETQAEAALSGLAASGVVLHSSGA